MIIANLVGGLGNQMFQYACARALALELRLPLKVSCDMFRVYTFHNGPELERAFALRLDIAQPTDMKRMIGVLRASPVIRWALTSRALAPLRGRHFILEPHYHYWNGLLGRVRSGGYMQGYWQSERYFSKHATVIRDDFTFRRPPTGRNLEIAKAITDSVAVSVHVRRGDYVSNAKTRSVHGICPTEYYFQAIESLRRRVPGGRLFAFSDDPRWVAERLAPRYPDLVLVDHNRDEDSYNDMQLMSLCRHHIIANSSFSWWGAWLNPRPDKIVIAPKLWLSSGADTRDLLPSAWERM